MRGGALGPGARGAVGAERRECFSGSLHFSPVFLCAYPPTIMSEDAPAVAPVDLAAAQAALQKRKGEILGNLE